MKIKKVVKIDGQMGEGGGQVLRTALALSMASGLPFQINNIRANRKSSGLKRQHLTAVKASQEISGAKTIGAELNSDSLYFEPKSLHSGNYSFDIASGGSATLVLQAILPPVLISGLDFKFKVFGGTHVPMAPFYEFFAFSFLPYLKKMGFNISSNLEHIGFMEKGGGLIEVIVKAPLKPLIKKITWNEETKLGDLNVYIVSYNLAHHIAKREALFLKKHFASKLNDLDIYYSDDVNIGTGNYIVLEQKHNQGTFIATGLARRGLKAEDVALEAIRKLKIYQKSKVVIDGYLADQLLVPLALLAEGSFLTVNLTLHTETVLNILPLFFDIKTKVTKKAQNQYLIELKRKISDQK